MKKLRPRNTFSPGSSFKNRTQFSRFFLILSPQVPASTGADLLGGLAHPQPAPEHGDLAPSLLLALSPLHQVEAVVYGQRDIPLAHSGVYSASQKVGLRLQCHLHAVGQQQPQGAIGPDVVAVSDLV